MIDDRPFLCAPDSFKGTLPRQPGGGGDGARGRGRRRPVDTLPVADGGEGTMEALLLALGGETVGASVADPLGRPRRAGFALLEDGVTAVVEMAEASGWGWSTCASATPSAPRRAARAS